MSSTADFLSMWHRILLAQHQILYFNPFYTGGMRGRGLPHKYHCFFLTCKHGSPFFWFTDVFYWRDKVRETWHGESNKEEHKIIYIKVCFQSYISFCKLYLEIKRGTMNRFSAIEKISDAENVFYVCHWRAAVSKNGFPRSDLCILEFSQRYVFNFSKLSDNSNRST